MIKGIQSQLFTLNAYVYCWNQPINLVDLDGEWPQFLRDGWNVASDFWNTYIYGERTVYVESTGRLDGLAGIYGIARTSETRNSEIHTGKIIVRTRTVTNTTSSRATGFSYGFSLNILGILSVGVTTGSDGAQLNGSLGINTSGSEFRINGNVGFGGSSGVNVGGDGGGMCE